MDTLTFKCGHVDTQALTWTCSHTWTLKCGHTWAHSHVDTLTHGQREVVVNLPFRSGSHPTCVWESGASGATGGVQGQEGVTWEGSCPDSQQRPGVSEGAASWDLSSAGRGVAIREGLSGATIGSCVGRGPVTMYTGLPLPWLSRWLEACVWEQAVGSETGDPQGRGAVGPLGWARPCLGVGCSWWVGWPRRGSCLPGAG